MSDRSRSSGDDTLPLGLAQPGEREIEQAKRTMRHAFVSAEPATGTIYGVPVELLSETDKSLAFDWLMQQLHLTRAWSGQHVRPL